MISAKLYCELCVSDPDKGGAIAFDYFQFFEPSYFDDWCLPAEQPKIDDQNFEIVVPAVITEKSRAIRFVGNQAKFGGAISLAKNVSVLG